MMKVKKKVCSAATIFGLIAAIHGVNAQAATCNFSISNEWNSGYTGAVTIKNTGTSPIYSWDVSWQFTTNRITSSWNADVSGSNPYLASSLNWNGTIQPGQEVQFGVQVDKNGGTAETPLISGTVCDYGHESSSDASSLPTSSSSAPASSSASSASSVSSQITSGQQCNWYGTLYPICVSTQSGWGWEDSQSCIATTTCASQPAPYGVVGGNNSSSSTMSSSSMVSSISSASSSSIVVSSSSSSITSSVVSSSTSSLSSNSSSPASSSSAPSSSSASSSSSSTAAGVLFSEDFEGDTDGTQPAGWDNFIGWIGNGPNPNGTAYALVESGRAVSGSKAVHFSGGQSPAMITRALPAGTNTLYVSAWVYMTRQLGMNPGDNHETLVALRGSAGNANNEVRFGEIKGVIGTNEVPSDNIAPVMANWGNGPAFASDTWHCVEVGFLSEPAYDEVHAWINGTEVHSITRASDWNNGPLPADWLTGKFTEIAFGWHSFSQNEVDVWMDDIVVSTERIGGCD